MGLHILQIRYFGMFTSCGEWNFQSHFQFASCVVFRASFQSKIMVTRLFDHGIGRRNINLFAQFHVISCSNYKHLEQSFFTFWSV